jgi:hypothetical protein
MSAPKIAVPLPEEDLPRFLFALATAAGDAEDENVTEALDDLARAIEDVRR